MKLFDTTSLILFLEYIPEYSCINLIFELDGKLLITSDVEMEFVMNSQSALSNEHDCISLNYCLKNKIINIAKDCDYDKLKNRYPSLGKGELSIMALGQYFNKQNIPYKCVLDDKTARKKAKELNLNFTGSIGIIKIIKDNYSWDNSKIDGIVKEIEASAFRVSDEVLEILYE